MGLATGLAIAAGAQAIGGYVSAKKKSDAAKKAAEQQVQGTQEATGYVREGLGQLGQLYSPYVNAGASAMGTLGRLTTPGPGARYASQGPPNAMPQPSYPNPNQAVPRGYGGPPQGYGGGPPQGGGGYGGTFSRMGPPQGQRMRPSSPPPGYYQY